MPDPFEDWLKPISSAPAGLDDWASKIPDPFPDQERRMQEARVWANQQRGAEKEFGFGLGLRLRTRDLSLPFQGAANSIARGIAGVDNPEVLRVRAQEAFGKGEATDEQLARLALYEYEDARNKSLGTAGAIGQGVAHAAPIVGEALVGGGAVKGLGGLAGSGATRAGLTGTANVIQKATSATPVAGRLGQMAQGASTQALATPLTPGLWLDESQQRAAENGGNWYDPKNVAAPMVKAAFQNAIMGHLGEGTKGLGIAKRVGLGSALMPAEQAGADALTTLAEKGWKEAGMDEKWATKTEWGTIGQFMKGESGEGWKSLATQATLGALFAGFHGQKSDPVGNLGKAVDSLAKDGVPQDLAGRVIAEAMVRPPETIKNPDVKAFVEAIIDLTPVESPKTRSAEAKSEPVQSATEAQKTATAKPQTAAEALKQMGIDSGGDWVGDDAYTPPAAKAETAPVEKPKKKGLGKKAPVKPAEPTKHVESIEEAERRETYGEPPGGVERRRYGLRFEGSEPITEGVSPAEKHAIDKYGKENLYRVKVNDAEGKEVADAIIKEEGDTLIVPWLGKKGASSGEGKGKDIFGAREITALGKQLAEAYPDMNILKYQVGNARNAAGEQRIIDLNKYRARQAKKETANFPERPAPEAPVSQSDNPVEPPKQNQDSVSDALDKKYKREASEMMERHAKIEKDLYEKYQKASKGKSFAEQSDAYQRYHEAQRAHGFEKDDLYKSYYGKKETANEPARPAEPAQEGTRVEEARPAEAVREPEPVAEPVGGGTPESVAPRPADDVPQWRRSQLIREEMAKAKKERDRQAELEAKVIVENLQFKRNVGEVSVPAAKATFQKIKAQDAEWREGHELPKGEKWKQLLDRIAKEGSTRWALPKTVTEHGWATDTKHAVKATPEMIEYAKSKGHDKIEGRAPPMKDIIPKQSKTTPASIKSQMVSDLETGTNQVHVSSKDGETNAVVDADYIANVKNIYPNAKMTITTGKNPMIVFYEGKEPVGLVMPLGEGNNAPEKVSKHPALDIGEVFEKGPNDPKKMVSGRQTVTAEDGTFLAIDGSDTRKEWRIKDFPERKYTTIAQVQKAAREILQYAHGKDENGDLIFKIKGAKEPVNQTDKPAEPEGFGRTMTPEEREAGQVGGGSPLADELPRMEGLKELALANENVDSERVRNGLQPLMSRARAKFGEVWDQAMAKLGMDPNLSADLVSGLEKKMRNISPEESALLLHRRIQFSNEYERTIRQANAAAMKNDWNGFERFDNRAKELLEQMNRLDRVMRDVGTEAGRTLAFRRQLAAEDFSLTRMMGEMTRAKKGALTPEEMQKVQDQADRIQKLEERLRDFERKEAEEADVIDLQPAEQPGMIQRVKEWLGSLFPRQRPTLGAAKRGKVWDFADRMEKEAASELKAKFGSGNLFSNPMFDPSTIASLSKYTAAKIIKSGLTFADFSSQIIARFGDAVKPHLKEIWDGAQKHVEVGKMDKVDTQVELKKTKAEVMEDRAKFERKNQSVGRKLWEGTKETNNLMRAIQTAWDVSAVGRQGGPISLSSPTLVPAAVKDMVKSLRSERGYERAQQEILNRKNALDYQIAELEFTDHNADPTKQEESLMGRYVQKLPGLAASSRAFNGYLNRLRADKFDAMALNVTSTGPQRVVELKAIANYINAMTGRGKTGYKRIDDATAHLAQVFFSPRHALSRFQVLSGQPFWGAGTWKAKKMIAKEYAKYAIGMGAVYGLAKLALGDEAEIEKDSRSSDFGKIKIGKTRIDPLAGFSQSAVVSRRLLWGEMKAAGSNEVKDLRGPGHKFKDPTSIDVAGRFIRNKLSPLGGEVSDKLFPEFTPPGVGPLTDATGRKKGLTGWAIRQADKFQPLTAGDIYDAFKEHGIPRATALSLLNLLGWGTQVHERQPKAK